MILCGDYLQSSVWWAISFSCSGSAYAPTRGLAAENLFLCNQLAFYMGRGTKSRRASNATRVTPVILSRFIDWRALLTIVQPGTLVRWHR